MLLICSTNLQYKFTVQICSTNLHQFNSNFNLVKKGQTLLHKAFSPIMQIMGNWMHSWLCFFLNLEVGILSEEAFFILSWYIYERTKLQYAFSMILRKLQIYFMRTYLCKCTISSSKMISHHWSQSRVFDAYLPSCWRVTATQWK